VDIANKGVDIEVYLDADPTGGVPLEEAEVVESLVKAGSEVHFLKSTSIKNFHYKFAVIDGKKVVITTENWKWSNRGYIVEFESKKVADFLKKVVENDTMYESEMGKVAGIKGAKVAKGGKTFRFKGKVEVFVLPDCNPIFDVMSESRERLYVQVPYMDFEWFNGTPLLDSILHAARNGADVKILLDSRYNAKENGKVADFLNEIGRKEGLRIEAKLMDGLTLHAKMVVADGKCVVTSANFNRYGLKLNREAGVVIYSKEASDFLAEQFMSDWNGEMSDLSEVNGRINVTREDAICTIIAVAMLTASIAIVYRAMKK
jgi:phosphatidylserine/phosphatidylglycerophosphate/cardiolipin synthase-like enzyme